MSSRRGKTWSRGTTDGWEAMGGYMNVKKQKLQDQFADETPGQLKKEGSGSKIFAGINIHVNGYTKPSSDELKRLMMLHGGGYEHYLYRTRVSHVIATNLPNSKVKELKGLKVVRPEWITDSIAAGKLLSYTKYLLYTAQSGLQKGLQTFSTSRQNSNQSEGSLQSINSINSDTTPPRASDQNTIDRTDSETSGSYSVGGDFDTENHVTSVVSSASKSISTANINTKEIRPSKENGNVRKQMVSPGKMGDSRDPKFLNEYYSNSRLHYLSTWKSEWKNYVNELQSKGDNFPGREKLRRVVLERAVTPVEGRKGKPQRCVMHIDMDCFFVSVGLRNRPDLRGKPVAVTHSKGKGSAPDPESDLNFERHQWELKRLQGGKKGKKRVQQGTAPTADGSDNEQYGSWLDCAGSSGSMLVTNALVDTSFPDQSDSDSDEDDVTDDVTTVTKTTTESFHSMAEIASCSYEARQAGVRNGMFMGGAKSVCPDLVTIPYDFEGYKTVSKILYDTVASYTHDIEAVSCDEMLVDCTDLLADTGATPTQFSTLLRSEIFEKTACPASAGLGSSILLARMATRKAKPNGQFYLTEELVGDYIKLQPVKDLPGVGWSTTKRFEAMKVVTCGDLQKLGLDILQKEFGPKTGQSLYRYCRGQDDRPIKMEQQRKSVSAEVNYGIRFTTDAEAVNFMEELSEEVCNRLKNIKMKGKTITLKLMVRREDAPKQTAKFMGHGICTNYSKSVSLPMATDNPRIVAKETIGLLRTHKVEAADLRGIGIQVQKLETAEIGSHGNSKKLPSILNYTVNKSLADRPSTRSAGQPEEVNGRTGQPSVRNTLTAGVKDVKFTNISDMAIQGVLETDTVTSSSDAVKSGDLRKRNSESYVQDIDRTNHESTISALAKTSSLEDFAGNVVDGQLRLDVAEEDMLEDLGRRQTAGPALPPLPCLPDIRTPESAKKSIVTLHPETVSADPPEIDYFPSPSQVDPDVLKELPSEIREQIETELKQRRKKTNTVSTELSAPGCSHWQQEARNKAANKGNLINEEIQIEADKHSHDAIVPLPSPSQLDPSCLEALPASLQAELRQAYARQETGQTDSTRGANTLQLKQAKSPSKSPNKRSPGKGSPKFKVPRGRPSGRGRPKGSSKKTLFKDHGRAQQQFGSHGNIQNHHGSSRQPVEILESEEDAAAGSVHLQTGSRSAVHDPNIDRLLPVDQSDSVASTSSEHSNHGDRAGYRSSVNLCGAVTLQDVRELLKEWITSTPVPQSEDEEVLQRYLEDLIADKNLEQVDLLLKFMFRKVNHLQSSDWLYTLKRIFSHTQAVVYELYGSRLVSVTL